MMEGMDGPHLFEITVKSNDSATPATVLQVKADFEASAGGGAGAMQ